MELLLTGLLSLLIGAAIGALITGQLSANGKKNKEIEKHLHEAQSQLKSYQLEVSEHFEQTATLLDKLNDSYREVHNHLADASQTLLDPPHASAPIKSIPAREEIGLTADKTSSDSIVPPLDYAPKTSPYDRGMLDESFGLEGEKKQPEEPLQPAI